MIEKLRRMVMGVGDAPDLPAALRVIIEGVADAIPVDACAAFLVDPNDDHLVLMEVKGLGRELIGKVRLAPGEGVVGLVRERRGPVAMVDASQHPRFVHYADSGETGYRAFLGVPVFHYRQLIGVLSVYRRRRRKFGSRHEDFLVTASAQLASVLAASIVQSRHPEATQSPGLSLPVSEQAVSGLAGAPGVATGVVVAPSPFGDLGSVPDRKASDTSLEESTFRAAISRVQTALYASGERMKGLLPSEAHALFEVYALLVGDESLTSKVINRIRRGQWGPAALRDTIREIGREFDSMSDPRLRARGEDIRAVGRRILLELQVDQRAPRAYPKRTVLLGDEVSLARIAEVPRERLAGIICLSGSVLSHTAVVARALGVPAVMGLGELSTNTLKDKTVIVDGYQGQVYVDPPPAVKKMFARLEAEERALTDDLSTLRDLSSRTPDGVDVPLYANAGLLADITPSLEVAPEGVGLYRSEFPFMLRETFPSEVEQAETYRQILAAFAPRPVVMRTLDVGGDKPLPYFRVEESNSLLGWRGIRITLQHPEIFLAQARAMLRANEGLGNLEILLPMISLPGEVEEASALLDQAVQTLIDEGLPARRPRLGVMIEVPSALYSLDALLPLVDFLSIGTNDLTQYLLAVDRGNPRVASLYDHLEPSVLRAVFEVIIWAHKHGKPLSVCGELAGDPAGAVLLLGMGARQLSVPGSVLPRIKWVIRSMRQDSAARLTDEALALPNAAAVRALINAALEELGLGGLLHAGR